MTRLCQELETVIRAVPPHRKHTFAGRLTIVMALAAAYAKLGYRPPKDYTKDEHQQVWDGILATADPASGTPEEYANHARWVLKRIKGFPKKRLKIFKAPRRGRSNPRVKKDMAFTIAHRIAMWNFCPRATWIGRGLYLLGGCGGMQSIELIFLRWSELRAARNAPTGIPRMKTGKIFTLTIWKKICAWMDEQPVDPRAVYVFPWLLFGFAQYEENLALNYAELPPMKELDNRVQDAATQRLTDCFDEFLEGSAIKQEGISFRSFRHTNISGYESEGVPPAIGMRATGQSSYETYVGYQTETEQDMAALGQITCDLYDPARMCRPRYQTITSGVERLTTVTEGQAQCVRMVVMTQEQKTRAYVREDGAATRTVVSQELAKIQDAINEQGRSNRSFLAQAVEELKRVVVEEGQRNAKALVKYVERLRSGKAPITAELADKALAAHGETDFVLARVKRPATGEEHLVVLPRSLEQWHVPPELADCQIIELIPS